MIKELEIGAMMEAVAEVVREYVSIVKDTLTGRINDLDSKIKAIPAGEKGDPGAIGERGPEGVPGKDGAPGAPGAQGVQGDRGGDGSVGPQGSAGIDGKPGRDGANGKDAIVDYDRIGAAMKEVVAVAVDEIPKPKDGAPGARGECGPAGEKGLDGAQGPQGASVILSDVVEALLPALSKDAKMARAMEEAETANAMAQEFISGLLGANRTEAEADLVASLALHAAAQMCERSEDKLIANAARIDKLQRTTELVVGLQHGNVEGIREIVSTLKLPVKPVYDKTGKLIAARREEQPAA